MAIVNALAGIMVSDLATAEAWYEHLLSRPAGISIERTTTSDYVKTATVTDPAGNRVVFAELTAQL